MKSERGVNTALVLSGTVPPVVPMLRSMVWSIAHCIACSPFDSIKMSQHRTAKGSVGWWHCCGVTVEGTDGPRLG